MPHPIQRHAVNVFQTVIWGGLLWLPAGGMTLAAEPGALRFTPGAVPPPTLAAIAPAKPSPSDNPPSSSTPEETHPPAATVEAIAVADTLQAKKDPTNPASTTVVFDGPSGNGRRGAKGILLKASPLPADAGTTWAFRYLRSASAYPLQIIHPLGKGQVVIHLHAAGVGISTPKAWVEVGYGTGDSKEFKRAEAFGEVFPLQDNTEYQVVSRLSAGGAYELLIDGKRVGHGFLGRAKPLSLEIPDETTFPGHGRGQLAFGGADLPFQWEAGWASLFVGPVDAGTHTCHAVRFYPHFVDAEHGTVAAIPNPPPPPKATPAPAKPFPPRRSTPRPRPSIPRTIIVQARSDCFSIMDHLTPG